jgi:preprotein translocase subunit YajC
LSILSTVHLFLAQATQQVEQAVTTAPAGVGTGGAAPGPTTGGRAPGFMDFFASPMFPLLLGIVVLYVFMFRSKKNQERQRQDMLGQMKRGDRVQTIGGILGKVVEVEDSKVLLKVDENSNTKIWFSRAAIQRVVTEEKSAAAAETK